ncbi:hypothetical protein SAMN05443574_12425 [Haloarcula vallismortis]|uniref:Uncharacterized protein n=2 Tax=Haloarcula vallismortis TaxID=28442 RepID=M0JNK6_HALVA|nr:hypothetical protein C437_04780 [Haloarcula vallismortis ATCC 29715]SDX28086.1 hypothetical protein SAMN05443574_12425 [Haloarcula vallismortis]
MTWWSTSALAAAFLSVFAAARYVVYDNLFQLGLAYLFSTYAFSTLAVDRYLLIREQDNGGETE